MTKEQAKRQERLIKAFTPNRPIDLPEFLAGRKGVLYKAQDAARTPGSHIVLFGERGSGKTSIARVVAYNLQEPEFMSGHRSILVQCDSSDNYQTVWSKISNEILIKQRQFGFIQHEIKAITGRLDLDTPIANPNEAKIFIQSLPNPSIIVIDEFDRAPINSNLRILMADTIKLFSDTNVDSTIIIVGVAESITELIVEHGSVVRNISQILVPQMNSDELSEIIQKGYRFCDLEYENGLERKIADMSQGYPHYTHLLGLWAGRMAVEKDRASVTFADLENALPMALENTIGSVRQEYEHAVTSTKRNALYKDVLLACALTKKDALGRFSLVDVREPLNRITGRDYSTGAYQSHLARFCEPQRGAILKRTGTPKNYRWKFTNPQLITFVRLQGIQEGRIAQ